MKQLVTQSIVFIIGLSGPLAAQPFSKSMAECAGLYQFGAAFMTDPERAYLFDFGQAKWINAAVVQAQTEGVADPAAYVATAQAAKYQEWTDRGAMAVFSEDMGDWFDYCRSFAEARGIDLHPD